MSGAARREDVLVSVCFPNLAPGEAAHTTLRQVAAQLDGRYRYWEILALVDANADGIDRLLIDVPNLRLLQVRAETEFYRRRVVAASEAIGDIVAIAALDEVAHLDLMEMIEAAHTGDGIARGRRVRRSLIDPLVRTLGRAGGFEVDTRDMQTAVYPRTLLNRLLAHPNPQLALRFVPRGAGLSVMRLPALGGGHGRTLHETGRRLNLVQQLLVSAAPLVLTWVSLLSALVFVISVFFGIYAVAAWATLSTVAPGWLTLSLAISMTAAFLATALFGLSTGLQKLLEMVTPDRMDEVVGERNGVDLFSQVTQELNIELSSEPPEPDPAVSDAPPLARSEAAR
ncbi:MAG: hypothetical protein ACI87T_001334 [Planctomycetota bacterium]|jgi:hypothetical protein